MRKIDKIKFIILSGFTMLVLFFAGCVDTGVNNIPQSLDLRSEINIVNLTVGSGTATVKVYGSIADPDALSQDSLASKYDVSKTQINTAIAFGNETGYKNLPAGSKMIIVNYSGIAKIDTFKLVANTNYKLRMFLFGNSSGRSLVKSTERYLWQKPGSSEGASLFPANKGFVKIVDASPDADDIVSVDIMSSDTVTVALGLSFKDIGSYIELKSGTNYTFTLLSSSGTLSTFTLSPSSKGRYTAIMYDAAATLKSKVFTDD